MGSPPETPARAELARLLGLGSPTWSLLRRRAEILVGLGALLGAAVAGVHLAVWAVLAVLTTSLAPPTGGEVAFSAVVVVLTTVVAAAAYRAPRQRQWSQPALVGAVAVLEVVTFVVHGLVLTPSLAEVRRHVGGGPLALEVAMTVGALVGVMLLFLHEVADGVAGAAARSAEPGVPGPS